MGEQKSSQGAKSRTQSRRLISSFQVMGPFRYRNILTPSRTERKTPISRSCAGIVESYLSPRKTYSSLRSRLLRVLPTSGREPPPSREKPTASPSFHLRLCIQYPRPQKRRDHAVAAFDRPFRHLIRHSVELGNTVCTTSLGKWTHPKPSQVTLLNTHFIGLSLSTQVNDQVATACCNGTL